MTNSEASELVIQLQHAHRISVAFYRRILPSLDSVAAALNCQFCYWEPLHTSPPGRRTSKPSSGWAWDFVPLFASHHFYWRSVKEKASRADVGLGFKLYVDTNFDPSSQARSNRKEQPDPVALPIGAAVLRAYVYRPIDNSKQYFSDMLENVAEPNGSHGEWATVGANIRATWFEWPLANVILDVKPLIELLRDPTT